MAEWRYVKPLENEEIIKQAETQLGITFNSSYIAFVKKYNGGRPPVSIFDTDKKSERTIKSFLSLNPADIENILKTNLAVSKIRNDIIAFGIDNFGNYICFNKSDGTILFLDFESNETEYIAANFDAFLQIVNG